MTNTYSYLVEQIGKFILNIHKICVHVKKQTGQQYILNYL